MIVVEFRSWLFIILAEFSPATTSLPLGGNLKRLSDFAFVFSSMSGRILKVNTTEALGELTVVTGGDPVLERALARARESFFFLNASRSEGSFKVSRLK